MNDLEKNFCVKDDDIGSVIFPSFMSIEFKKSDNISYGQLEVFDSNTKNSERIYLSRNNLILLNNFIKNVLFKWEEL